jgi:hypothetical protein
MSYSEKPWVMECVIAQSVLLQKPTLLSKRDKIFQICNCVLFPWLKDDFKYIESKKVQTILYSALRDLANKDYFLVILQLGQ